MERRVKSWLFRVLGPSEYFYCKTVPPNKHIFHWAQRREIYSLVGLSYTQQPRQNVFCDAKYQTEIPLKEVVLDLKVQFGLCMLSVNLYNRFLPIRKILIEYHLFLMQQLVAFLVWSVLKIRSCRNINNCMPSYFFFLFLFHCNKISAAFISRFCLPTVFCEVNLTIVHIL